MAATIEQVINALKCKRDRIVGCSLKCPYHVIKRLGDGDAESSTFTVNGAFYFDKCDIIGLCRDAADLLESMSEKSEKHKWHDLRKNPEDLPTKDGDYMCMVNATQHPERPMTYEPWDLGIKGGNKWRDFSGYVFDHFVIAWREIETFEGESNAN